jgi:hypothetical protein
VKLTITLNLAGSQFTGYDDNNVDWGEVTTAVTSAIDQLYSTQLGEPHTATLEIRDWNDTRRGSISLDIEQ